MQLDTERLSREITDVVRGVEGVTAVYESRPLVEGVATRVSELVGGDGIDRRLADVDLDDDALRIRITVGSDPSQPAGDVCRRVRSAVARHLEGDRIAGPTEIAVVIGRVG